MNAKNTKSPNTGDAAPELAQPSQKPWWLAPILLTTVVILGYGIAPTRLPLMGEETCRALHGIEMARSGDWLVATNQGVPRLDRPPLQYWTLAVIHKWIHPLDPLTVRLFMVIVTLVTALIIQWYSKSFLSDTAAFLAAVAYPTMGHVFDLGRRAETDGLFAMLLAAALMVWHHGYSQRWRPIWTWTFGAAVAALATLAKGSQGPVAFFGTVYLFLLIRRDWRYLLCWSHVLGIVVFLSMIGVWQVPFYLVTGWDGTQKIWLAPYVGRMDTDIHKLLLHLVEFPVNMFGATLPWSALLLGLCNRRFWRLEGKLKSAVLFVLLGMVVIFFPVWISEGGHHRYIMPMYPLMAVLCGVVVQQALAADLTSFLRQFWYGYVRVMAMILAGFVTAFLMATLVAEFSDAHWVHALAQSWSLMTVWIICTVIGVTSIFRYVSLGRTGQEVVVTFAIASMLAICFNGAIVNATARRTENIGPDVIALHRSLSPQTQLVSFGQINEKFVYWYGEPIPILDIPKTSGDLPDDLGYFAINVQRGQTVEMSFEWEQIATFSTERKRNHPNPKLIVLVGRWTREKEN
ncbi:MAG TPA: glycosyltransferase family 39 protein [Sedimentisphaerales bacterium]|nr:glycosyltransferase family 39 protein [Sedimentisphaerales bacterium]